MFNRTFDGYMKEKVTQTYCLIISGLSYEDHESHLEMGTYFM